MDLIKSATEFLKENKKVTYAVGGGAGVMFDDKLFWLAVIMTAGQVMVDVVRASKWGREQ